MIPIWMAWTAIAIGLIGMVFVVWAVRRRNLGYPMHPDASKADRGLFVSGGVLVLLGMLRLAGWLDVVRPPAQGYRTKPSARAVWYAFLAADLNDCVAASGTLRSTKSISAPDSLASLLCVANSHLVEYPTHVT